MAMMMIMMMLMVLFCMMLMIEATSFHDSFAFVSGQQKARVDETARRISPLSTTVRQTAAPVRSKLTHLLAVVPRNRLRMCASTNGQESGIRRLSSLSSSSTPGTLGRRMRNHKKATKTTSIKNHSPAKDVFASIVMP